MSRKYQWQRNCFSNPDASPDGAWKAIDTYLDSDIVDELVEERGAVVRGDLELELSWEEYNAR